MIKFRHSAANNNSTNVISIMVQYDTTEKIKTYNVIDKNRNGLKASL